MVAHDIPLDKAELLSVILEAILYGFSLLMFIGTIWVLVFRRSRQHFNREMLGVACILLFLSTMHIVIHIIRVMEGLILDGLFFPDGVNAFFANPAQWTFVWKNYVYIAQSLVGDSVVIYRCYKVWQTKLVIVFPLLLWCGACVTGFAGVHAASVATNTVFDGVLSHWITSFWAMALSTNLLATGLLAWRIWYIDHKSKRHRGHQKSHLLPVLRIIIDAGLLYTATLLAGLICFLCKTNAQYVTLDMISPIISITFYMVIIRTWLYRPNDKAANAFPLDQSISGNNMDGRNVMQVRVTTLTENNVERGDVYSKPTRSRTPISPVTQREDLKLGDV